MNLHRSEISRRWAAILARLKETQHIIALSVLLILSMWYLFGAVNITIPTVISLLYIFKYQAGLSPERRTADQPTDDCPLWRGNSLLGESAPLYPGQPGGSSPVLFSSATGLLPRPTISSRNGIRLFRDAAYFRLRHPRGFSLLFYGLLVFAAAFYCYARRAKRRRHYGTVRKGMKTLATQLENRALGTPDGGLAQTLATLCAHMSHVVYTSRNTRFLAQDMEKSITCFSFSSSEWPIASPTFSPAGQTLAPPGRLLPSPAELSACRFGDQAGPAAQPAAPPQAPVSSGHLRPFLPRRNGGHGEGARPSG